MIITPEVREYVEQRMKSYFGNNFVSCHLVVCVEHLDVYVKLKELQTYASGDYDNGLLKFCIEEGFSSVLVHTSDKFITEEL